MKKWIAPNVIALILLAVLVLLLRGKETLYQGSYFVDAFSISGFFLLIGTGFVYVNTHGVFDIVVYGVKKIIYAVKKKPDDFPNSYFEYNDMRKERDKIILWPAVVVGLIYIIIGLIIFFIS